MKSRISIGVIGSGAMGVGIVFGAAHARRAQVAKSRQTKGQA